ncbi:MAG: Nucleoporin nup84 [Lichina confinis]|nr:MAG: Nucleoporin nup84 [Lichina confinis]
MEETAPFGTHGLLQRDIRQSESLSESQEEPAETDTDRDGDHLFYERWAGDKNGSPAAPLSPEEYRDLIHPLQAMADRVGREAEQFAEQLERLNPEKHADATARYEAALELAGQYEEIAKNTAERLDKQHGGLQRKLLSAHWQRKINSPGGGQAERLSQTEVDVGGEDADEAGQTFETETHLADLWYWRQEKQTWALFRRLAEYQCPHPGVDRQKEKKERLSALGDVLPFSPEEKIWARFYVEDDLARERHAIVTWLQECAEFTGKDMELIVRQIESASDGNRGLWTDGWLHTREAIKSQKRIRSWPQHLDPASPALATTHLNADRTESLVTQLDPDAATRERRVLEKPDQFQERCLWLACWQMLRRGKSWTEIREWFHDRSEGWRASSLRGAIPELVSFVNNSSSSSSPSDPSDAAARVFHDVADPSRTYQVRGPKNRAVWRRMCLANARQGGGDDYERAVYGTLAGDLESVERVCSSWEDFVFVHHHALVLSQFERYLMQHHPDRLPAALARIYPPFDAVQLHGEPSTVGRRIVDQLKRNDTTRREAHEPMKLVQAALIAHDFEGLVRQQGLVLGYTANQTQRSNIIAPLDELGEKPPEASDMPPDDMDTIRVMCHIMILLQDMGVDFGVGPPRLLADNVIAAYMDFLRLSGKITMVPLYATRLGFRRQYHTLGVMMMDVASPDLRKTLVRLMQGYDISVTRCLESMMTFIRIRAGMVWNIISISAVSILEDSDSVVEIGRRIRKVFVGSSLRQHEEALVAGFEWYMLVGGWQETFESGIELFIRFFQWKSLAAARALADRMSGVQISLAKTHMILGKSIDIFEADLGAEDDLALDPATLKLLRFDQDADKARWREMSPSDRRQLVQQVLLSKAKLYREFECLTWALVNLEAWREALDSRPPNVDPRGPTEWKDQLQDAFEEVVESVEPLLHGWLTDVPQEHAADCTVIRNAYLPEIVLAYNSVLFCAGHVLSRSHLLKCMTLSTTVAAPDSDVLPCFLAAPKAGTNGTGAKRLQVDKDGNPHIVGSHRRPEARSPESLMQELVTGLAKASKAILRSEEQGSGKKGKGGGIGGAAGALVNGIGGGAAVMAGGRKSAGKKSRRGKSESMGLWSVK